MMTPVNKPSPKASEASGIRSGMATPINLPSLTARRRRKLLGEKRCASLSASRIPKLVVREGEKSHLSLPKLLFSDTRHRNSSMQSLKQLNDNLLTLSLSMKTVAADEDKEHPLPRSAVAKNLRLMAKKRREFIQMQRILIHQQNTYIDLYAQMRDLETRSGVDPGDSVGQVRVVALTGWPAYDLLLLIRDDSPNYQNMEVNGVIGPASLKELKTQMSTIPEDVLNMGADLMARRLEILDFLRTRQRLERCSNNHDWKTKNSEFDKETENLHSLVVETAKDLEAKVIYCLNIAKTSWMDREALIKKIERLQREMAICHNKLPEVKNAPGDKPNNGQEEKPANNSPTVTPSNTKLLDELHKERAARESLKHVVSSAEGMLRTARARITFLERQLKDTRAQLDASIRKHKEYEMLHRHRETSYDARSRKLLEVSKNGEVTIEMLSRQRDALELRVKELQDQTKIVGQGYEARELEYKSRLDALQAKLAEQERQKKVPEARVQELERKLKVLQEQYNSLVERSKKLVKLDNERCVDYLPRKEREPSEKETELWKELQVTKKKLERVSEELRQSRADKDSLLNSLSRIAQEGPVENKMANELVNREQKIFSLQRNNDDLKQTIKTMEDSMAQKDTQLMSYKVEVAKLRNYECFIAPSKDSASQDLALDLIDLSAQVTALTRERAALKSAVASHALMLERHERCADVFAQITRARRQLAAELEGRSEHRLTQAPLIDVNVTASLTSVCNSAAEAWTELRTERERVLKLQNVVVSQNVQLNRESRIRTHLEQRRATLERYIFTRETPNPCNGAIMKQCPSIYSTLPYFADKPFET